MGFVTNPPFCMAYPLSFADKEDPAWMTFQNPQNHPTSFSADVLLVCQLLATRLFSAWVRGRQKSHASHYSPGVTFLIWPLSTDRCSPRPCMAPYRDPRSGVEAPFFTMGLFASTDTLFPGTAGDLDLFTDEEVFALTSHWGSEIPNNWHIWSPCTITCLKEWSGTHPLGNEATKILRAAGILYPPPRGVLKT